MQRVWIAALSSLSLTMELLEIPYIMIKPQVMGPWWHLRSGTDLVSVTNLHSGLLAFPSQSPDYFYTRWSMIISIHIPPSPCLQLEALKTTKCQIDKDAKNLIVIFVSAIAKFLNPVRLSGTSMVKYIIQLDYTDDTTVRSQNWTCEHSVKQLADTHKTRGSLNKITEMNPVNKIITWT